jgi:hypothetical protein
MKWARGDGVFIGPKSSKHPVQRGVHLMLLPSGPKVVLYIHVLTSGESKK